MVRIKFNMWLVSGYAHVFVVLSAIIVTLLSELSELWHKIMNRHKNI